VDGGDDGDLQSPAASQPTSPFQSPDPAAGMAETGRPPDLPDLASSPPPPPPPPPPPAAGLRRPAVHLRFRIEGGDIYTLGVMGKWVRARKGARKGDFTRGFFNNFKDIKDHKGAIWM
jgi:hypothetical protein